MKNHSARATPFGRWVTAYTVPQVCHATQVTPWTVYGWLSGAHYPPPRTAKILSTLSGLTINQIYSQPDMVKGEIE